MRNRWLADTISVAIAHAWQLVKHPSHWILDMPVCPTFVRTPEFNRASAAHAAPTPQDVSPEMPMMRWPPYLPRL